MKLFSLPKTALAVLAAVTATASATRGPSIPPTQVDQSIVINLGYAQYNPRLTILADSSYLFSNVRYGSLPVKPDGQIMSFSRAQIPKGNGELFDGTDDVICPQAWSEEESYEPLTPNDQPFRESEDCLFLDVWVPGPAMDALRQDPPLSIRPVAVWFHEAPWYRHGSKYDKPLRIVTNHLPRDDAPILVSVNYRLGMFGFSNAPNVTRNLGLWDQHRALEWVQQYIHLFGGDKSLVTLMGQFSGAGSVLHHLTAWAGEKQDQHFSSAVMISPTLYHPPSRLTSKMLEKHILHKATFYTGEPIKSFEDLRQSNTDETRAINLRVVEEYPKYFVPAVDGSLVPANPLVMLRKGLFDHNVKVMVGNDDRNSAWEVGDVNSYNITKRLREWFPRMSYASAHHVMHKLYPGDTVLFDESYGTPQERLQRILHDAFTACNGVVLAQNNPDNVWKWSSKKERIFEPGRPFRLAHEGESLFDVATPAGTRNGTVIDGPTAELYIAHFLSTGDPNWAIRSDRPVWEKYGVGKREMRFGLTKVYSQQAISETQLERCKWWAEEQYQPLQHRTSTLKMPGAGPGHVPRSKATTLGRKLEGYLALPVFVAVLMALY